MAFQVGTACCALYSEDGCWYRGIIRELHLGSVTVFFADYGNSENVEDSFVKQLPDSLRSIPCQAVAFRLSGAIAMDAAAATARLDEILADQVRLLCQCFCFRGCRVHYPALLMTTCKNRTRQGKACV